ncbi:tol-pal system-associated acyl-CoA thioesterase [Labrys miyagiensis]|uniref:Tol-pal system-associated acyl-CoA thioesterase n=1 Tax=Labrys miyagiensis TaxID=346912 RepID=A0ABQ6CN16_9HYPH|nr:tol-pal system-associated acyl-CoA thioesterase [Labrys miyagiensis]GLS21721.1 tol-pal system-associated acyl-CoA thioesterase [Labrys miyagiensis]
MTHNSGGVLNGDCHHLPLRVYYEDTDFSGIVYHANYLRFFERGRTEFIRALGVDQMALHREEGISFAVRSISVDFLRPALMDDIIEVQTKAGLVRGPSLNLTQTIRRGEDVLTTAEVLVVCVKAGRPQRLPEVLRKVLAERKGEA